MLNALFLVLVAEQDWELVVLQALKWDVAGVTAADFVDVILGQLSLLNVDASRRQARVRQHALTFIVLCALGNIFCSLMCIK